MNFTTPRKRALGHGSGRSGTHHHWKITCTSIALCLLVPVFVITFGVGYGGTFQEVQAFFSRPFPVIITALTLIVGLMHLTMEVNTALEDYVHGIPQKLAIFGATAFSYVLMAIGLFALARMAL